MMVRLVAAILLYSLVLPRTSASAQTPSPSASPKITTATCGKPFCTWNAFGAATYTRETGKPQTISSSFSVLNPNTHFTLHIDNNGVSSAVISVNGIQVFGPDDFNPGVTGLDRPVSLAVRNTLQVELRSVPGASLAVTVIGVDNDPPTVLESQSPQPKAFGWNNTNVSVSFACSDATSGIASCPSPVLLTTEGLNQVVSGTSFDLAGNSETASFQVSIDKSPPTIVAAQSPPANSFGWNNTPVTISFSCNDNLSGVQSCSSPAVISSEGQNQSVDGMAIDFAGNTADATATLNIDLTPPVVSIGSPANGSMVTAWQLQISGTVSDNLSGVAAVSCNGLAAQLSGGSYSCALSLTAGANVIQVKAVDRAGNTSNSQISVTFNAVPPKSVLITPSLVNMLVGNSRSVALVGDAGQPVSGATWTISDPTVATITAADPPQITALTSGTATLTASFNGLTASITVNVLPGTDMPPGTPLWAFDPLPGNTITQMVPGNPVNPGDPDLFAVEAPHTLRAFTKDGQQLWAVSPGVSPAPATASFSASSSAPSAIQTQSIINPASSRSIASPFDAGPMAVIPADLQDLLRKHGAFDSLDLLARQQRFIEQQRLRAALLTAVSAPVASSTLAFSPLSTSATANVTTLLIKTVADNSGGTVSLVESFAGCCAIVQASLIKIDNATQQQVWRADFPGPIDANFAIGPDDTVYSSQLTFGGNSNLFFGSSSTSRIFALDGATGQQKFNLPLPPGHLKVTSSQGNPPLVTVLADMDVAAQPGPISILPDGSINAVVYTNHLEEDFQNFFGFSRLETAVSDHKTLQLLTIQPDGSFATQPIQAFDFDATNCTAPTGCKDPGAGYVPNEVVPDGQGGTLATWTGNDSQLGITNGSKALVRHFDNAGGTLDYVVPFASSSWFRIGGDNAQSLILGENNTAAGTDGQSIVAFNITTGNALWSFQPSGFQGSALLAASASGSTAGIQLADFHGEIDATPNALLSIDSTGAVTATPFAASNAPVAYFDANTLLALAEGGQGELVANVSAALDEGNPWNLPGANVPQQRNENCPRLESKN